ncbi:DUF4393 domain-containing protein [Sneathiella litorea]|uniref:DUF4393 domain-containing protein n=1 Tax=Sneathiella litorea TaxID=2606216 RepID=A0A6L8W7I8_9PROT|nr:DUF4393 domain-containing protein [Sneathiella litorea]MZR31056.1 DUF4393 domain-containing protein [Sneathiella litorea]
MDDDEVKPFKIKDAAEAVAAIAKAIPIYQDAIQPGAKEIGKAGKKVGETINALLSPFNYVIWKFEYFKKFVDEDVAKKLENTLPEDIIQPKLNVAGPLFETLRYSVEDVELREMFANLLANAMDKNTANKAHPSFVEILKQITSDEAKIMQHFNSVKVLPKIDIVAKRKDQPHFDIYMKNYSLVDIKSLKIISEMAPIYIDNLCRFGLLTTYDGVKMIDETKYEPLLEHKMFIDAIETIDGWDHESRISKGFISRTNYGSLFCEVCIDDKSFTSNAP